jgi:hypothetical protein
MRLDEEDASKLKKTTAPIASAVETIRGDH